jgi:thioredoxin 1
MEITDKNFENVIANNSVVMKLGAVWCGPCRQVDPIIKKIEAENNNFVVGSVDVDVNSVISTRYGVRNIPTILFFKEGQLVDKLVGGATETAIREKIATNF